MGNAQCHFTGIRKTESEFGASVKVNSLDEMEACRSIGATLAGSSRLFSAFKSELAKTNALPDERTSAAPAKLMRSSRDDASVFTIFRTASPVRSSIEAQAKRFCRPFFAEPLIWTGRTRLPRCALNNFCA